MRLSIGSATDHRLNFVNKLILGIQTIKNYAWEEPISHRIQDLRKSECRRFLKLYFCKGLSDGITRNANIRLAIPVVLVPLAKGEPLVASTIFTALSLVDSLSTNVNNLNFAISGAVDYVSVIKRAESVLLLEEKKEIGSSSQSIELPVRIKVK